MSPEMLVIWIAGTLPATYVAARRSSAWDAAGYTVMPLTMTAIMFWPIWAIGALIVQPLLWPIRLLYARIWNQGERDALTTAPAPATQPQSK